MFSEEWLLAGRRERLQISKRIAAPGGLEAGLGLARVCLAGRAEVSLVPSSLTGMHGPSVQVSSDDPVMACMASQPIF